MNRETFNEIFLKNTSEFTWTTWDGVKKKISEIDHQHLSNIHHFMKIFNSYDNRTKSIIMSEIHYRFAGQILPYRPIGKYKAEIDFLREKGYLVTTEHYNCYNIVVDNKWIGEYRL